ncbi:MAG: tRNA pseudouridine(38-40) synthase TruA [Betaproteobacteria bacterium RBG_16_64_9]|nr:MAG: tRNA pseudouridine(38-40) synthase TruA [Betaproteobacteria bacterium RBG_16_64_9]OGA21640.1 MAG: tRNA pseudouridine(38-40) synthase TruA [Betaproteobacteria bacterium RIFCSPLOWO2_02_FULL_65_24]OGA90727.1 MAG: tRNA pseudouridine(38-40) synthase TruA [Betaproteobacteria bacterium RIFCSPLOWO2_12_FULL_66_14]
MRIALGIAYDGTGFNGWQSQPSGNTVQDRLEAALGEIAQSPVRIAGAGRTDAGVHAVGQVAHFDTDAVRPDTAWVRGTNAHLPEAIAVQWAMPVAADFDARYSARARRYVYLLYGHPVRPSVAAGKTGWFHAPLEPVPMREASQALLGRHDFSAFRSSECQAKTPVRTLSALGIRTVGPYVMFDMTADAFLHHMVRNIVGCLVYVGSGRQRPEWLHEVLQSRDRRNAAPTMSASGLYLVQVRYESRWSLPGFPSMIPFLPVE